MKSSAALKDKLVELSTQKDSNVDVLMQEIQNLRVQLFDKEEMIESLKRQAMEDGMTGLANRRAFEEVLSRSLSYFKRYGRHGALLMIDLDAFKSINDSLGHLAGDAILKHVASLLKTHTRDSDLVARLGGDEFCVVLKEINPRDLVEKAQEISGIIAHTPCSYEGREIYISASVGCCSFHQARNKDELLEKADKNMYAHKAESHGTARS